MNGDRPHLPHLRIDSRAEAKDYTSRQEGRDHFKMPARVDRQAHGQALIQQLEEIDAEVRDAVAERATRGVVLTFEGREGFDLRLKSLESVRAGIELLSAKTENRVMRAVVFVPQGRLSHFTKLVEDFISKDTPTGKPRNAKVVSTIAGIRRAAIEHFWTEQLPFPPMDAVVAWEVWLREGGDATGAVAAFREEAAAAGLRVGSREVRFPDRVVLMASGTAEQLSSSLAILDVLAELRMAKECPTTYLDMPAREQVVVADAFLTRVQAPPAAAPAVCVLDCGVHHGHPLLAVAITAAEVLTCFPGAPPVGSRIHGTEMAGLALYGDLTSVLGTADPVVLEHRLESVTILPAIGENHPDVYGSITAEAVVGSSIRLLRSRS